MYVLGDAFLPPPLTPPRQTSTKADASPLSPPKQHKIPKVLGVCVLEMQALGPCFGPLFSTMDNNKQAFMPFFPIFANATSHPLSWPLPPGREGHLTTAKQTIELPRSTLSYCFVPQMGQAGVACRGAGEGRNWRGEVTCCSLWHCSITCSMLRRSKRRKGKTGNVKLTGARGPRCRKTQGDGLEDAYL